MVLETILAVVSFFNLILSIFVFSKDPKSNNNRFFALLAFLAALWTFANLMTGIKPTPSWLQSTYALGSLVIATGLVWTLVITDRIFNKIKTFSVYYVALVFFILSYKPGFIASSYDQIFMGGVFTGKPGFGLAIFTIFYLLGALIILIKLLIAWKKAIDPKIKSQFLLIFYGALVTLTVSAFTSFILPAISIFNFGGLDSVGFLFFLIFISYAITKKNLFDIKVIATETFIFFIWIFILVRIFISEDSTERIINTILLLLTIIIGIFLIRSVIKEVTQREKIEKLAGELAGTNDKLKTVNNQLSVVNSQLEVSNVKLKEMDKQKTEFVSMASHQLRSPLTAIKGYTSMLLEGSYGAFEDRGREVLDRVLQSTNKLNTVIEDFLNITRIELGRMEYEISVFDLGQLVQTVVKDQEPNVTKKGLTIEFQDGAGNHQISADSGKVSQVISNLIDNAIKYTPARHDNVVGESGRSTGWIKVTVENVTDKKKEKVRFTVADSGVGLDPEAIKKLFQKFVRADDAGKINITGTGLGLYVAKQIVEGLSGKIWAESAGKDQGSRFIVEFPRSDKPVDIATNHQIEAYTRKDLKK